MKEKSKAVIFKLFPSDVAKLKKLAEKNDGNMSRTVRELIRAAEIKKGE